MIDQLKIGDKASFDDYGASISKRKIGQPKKKSIKETVPFSNNTYDFSAIDGELYWEERELEYEFEITAPTPEKLEEMKTAFANWIMNVMAEDLHDPFIPDYHFRATYDDMTFDDDEGLDKSILTVKFTAYPYKIANLPKVYDVVIPPMVSKSITITNESAHKVAFVVKTDSPVVVAVGGGRLVLNASGTYESESIKLPVGVVTISFEYQVDKVANISIGFFEEVF